MKTICYYIAVCLPALFIPACSNEIEIADAPDLQISVKSETVKLGEPFLFRFTGNADIVSFYSDEMYHQYAYRNGRVIEVEDYFLSFESYVRYGTQKDQLSIWYSTDFSGDYSSIESVNSAAWTDITSSFTIPPNSYNSATFVPSGQLRLADLFVDGKPLYFAFKYLYRATGANDRRTWRFQNFFVKVNTTMLGEQTMIDMPTAGFVLVDQGAGTSYATGSSMSASKTLLTLVGSATPPPVDTETWAITAPIFGGDMDKGPDRPIPIKGAANEPLMDYSYTYTAPGVYHVVFVASNTSIDDSKEVIREMDITVVP